MPVDNLPNFFTAFLNFDPSLLAKLFAVLFSIFYVVFAVVLFRQIQLMDRALPSPIAPFLKFLGILQVGVALAFMFVVIEFF